MVALLLTLLLEALDQTIVGTALPRIISSLQGFDRYTWVVIAYILASTTMVPIVGKLSDQFGRKWFMLVGVALFLLGSALAGTSTSMDQLITFRALQGLGAGMGIALVMTFIGDIFPPAERARWMGAFGGVYGFSNAFGPSIGGWIADHGPLLGDLVTDTTRWRWVFYVNLPLGALVLAALVIYLPVNISERSSKTRGWAALHQVDFAGAAVAAAATTSLLLGLTWGTDTSYGWGSPVVICLLLGAGVLFGAFVVVERSATEPILALDLFRSQAYTVASLLTLLQMMVLLGLFLYFPLFLQGILGVSASNSGLYITPMSLSTVVGAAVAGGIVARLQRYRIVTIVAAVIMTIGILLLSGLSATSTVPAAVAKGAVAGIGLGVFFSVLNLAAQNAIPRSRLGVGTASVRYIGQLGAVLGIAIVGTIVNVNLTSQLAIRLPADAATVMTPAGVKAATNPQILLNDQYRHNIETTGRQIAVARAVEEATANLPAGPQRDVIAKQVTDKTTQSVNQYIQQVLGATRDSLAVAIHDGFLVLLVFGVLMLVTTFFLVDVPFQSGAAWGPVAPVTPTAIKQAKPERKDPLCT
jgi:EmrB/QacA subfamily drug resistance transporter